MHGGALEFNLATAVVTSACCMTVRVEDLYCITLHEYVVNLLQSLALRFLEK